MLYVSSLVHFTFSFVYHKSKGTKNAIPLKVRLRLHITLLKMHLRLEGWNCPLKAIYFIPLSFGRSSFKLSCSVYPHWKSHLQKVSFHCWSMTSPWPQIFSTLPLKEKWEQGNTSFKKLGIYENCEKLSSFWWLRMWTPESDYQSLTAGCPTGELQNQDKLINLPMPFKIFTL